MTHWSLQFDASRSTLAFAALLAVIILAIVWRRYPAPASAVGRGARVGLKMLRILALMAVVFLLVRPVLACRGIRFDRPALAVLLDRSRSLLVRDIVPAGSRRPI